MAFPIVLKVLLMDENILPMSLVLDDDEPLVDEDLVDLVSTSAGTIFTVHAALGCPSFPHLKHARSFYFSLSYSTFLGVSFFLSVLPFFLSFWANAVPSDWVTTDGVLEYLSNSRRVCCGVIG